MSTPSNILAWGIPWKEKPGRLQSMGLHRVGHDWATLTFTLTFSSVQSLSHVWLFATPWTAARQASLSIINSRSSLKLMSIESVMPSSHLILCRPLLLLPPSPPGIRVCEYEWGLYGIFVIYLQVSWNLFILVPQYKIKYTFLFIFSCKCHVNMALIKGKVNENKGWCGSESLLQ